MSDHLPPLSLMLKFLWWVPFGARLKENLCPDDGSSASTALTIWIRCQRHQHWSTWASWWSLQSCQSEQLGYYQDHCCLCYKSHQYLCQQSIKQHIEKEQETAVSLPNLTQQIKQIFDTSIKTFAAALHFNSSTNEPFFLWKWWCNHTRAVFYLVF